MADSHATGQHDHDAPEHRAAPELAPAPESAPVESAMVPGLERQLRAAPPGGNPGHHSHVLRRLPSPELRRQFAMGLVRRHGNGYLQRVFSIEPAAAVDLPAMIPARDEESRSTEPFTATGPAALAETPVDTSVEPAADVESEIAAPLIDEYADPEPAAEPSVQPAAPAPATAALRWAVAIPAPPRQVSGRIRRRVARAPVLVPALPVRLTPAAPLPRSTGALTSWTMRGPPPAGTEETPSHANENPSDEATTSEQGLVLSDLTLSLPGDAAEDEAERVAEAVMRPDAAPGAEPSRVGGQENAAVHRRCAACDDDAVARSPIDAFVGRVASGSVARAIRRDVGSRIEALRGRGEVLPAGERRFFEDRLGVDLGRVRIHADTNAGALARAIDARAFAVGTEVAFGADEYRPGTTAGRRLIAHELVHVVQQGGAPPLRRDAFAPAADSPHPTPPVDEEDASPETAEGVCLVCGRHGRGTCACGQQFAPVARLARQSALQRMERQRLTASCHELPVARRKRDPEDEAIPGASIHSRANSVSATVARQTAPAVQRDDEGGGGLAQGLLDSIRGKANAEQQALTNEATSRAGEIEGQGQGRGSELEGKAAADGAALEGAGAAQEGQIAQDAAARSAAVQQQASAQAAQLNAKAASDGAAVQQDGAATASQLNGDFAALSGEAKATVAGAEGDLGGEASSLQAEGETGAGQVTNEVSALDGQTTTKVAALKDQTQALVDDRIALIKSAQGGKGDPEAIQKRLDDQQQRLDGIESGKDGLGGIEEAAGKIGERAAALWQGLTGKAQGLLERASGIAQRAWNTVQQGWSSLQSKASTALTGLKDRATAAWTGLKSAATAAWDGLKSGATAVWTGVKDRATAAWNGVKDRATAVANGVKDAADAAWKSVQSTVGPVVSAVGGKVQGVIGSVQGMLGKIGSVLSGAVDALIGSVRRATSAAVEGLKARAERAWNGVRSIGDRVWERVKGVGSRVWERVKAVAGKAWEGLKNVAGKAREGLKNLGTKAWEGLKNLGTKAWEGVKKGWEFVKGKAKQAFEGLKGALQKLKETAKRTIDWIKQKARDGLNFLKKQLGRLKDLLKRALAWLKEKWEWLKKKAVVRFCMDDRKLFDKHALKTPPGFKHEVGPLVVENPRGIGLIQSTYTVHGVMQYDMSGAAGPGTLRKTCITLEPLKLKASGEGELHVPGELKQDIAFTGAGSEELNLQGLIKRTEDDLKFSGSFEGTGAGVNNNKLTFEAGKLSLDRTFVLSFCLKAKLQLEGESRILVGTGPKPDGGGGFPFKPKLPDLTPKPLGGGGGPGPGSAGTASPSFGPPAPAPPGFGSPIPAPPGFGLPAPAPAPKKLRQISRLPFKLGPFTNEGCRRVTVHILYRVVAGVFLVPEKVDFDYEEISPEAVVKDMVGKLPPIDAKVVDDDEDDERDPGGDDVPGILAPVTLPIDLTDHENLAGAGRGHSIAKHVGKTPPDLRKRLKDEPRIPAATTFRSLPSGNLIVTEVVQANKADIDAFVATPGGAPRAFDAADVSSAKGAGVKRPPPPDDHDDKAIDKQPLVLFAGGRVVIAKGGPRGWFILTSFPI
jgi:hypothetical protein